MFLVGGFADSPMLQTEVRHEFQHVLKVVIPNEVSLAVLRGQSAMFQCHRGSAMHPNSCLVQWLRSEI